MKRKLICEIKKMLLSIVCIIAFAYTCIAQDVIVTKDSRKINAKVMEVNVDNVRYKNFDNQDGPVYTLLKNDIITILYQNGQVDTFGSEKQKNSTPTQTGSTYNSNPVDLLAEMQANNHTLYQQYTTGKRMTVAGGLLLVSGGIMAGVGFLLLSSADGDESKNQYGTELTVAGNLCIAAGIPILIVGGKKKKNALKEFSKQYYSASTATSHIQFNLYPNRLGVAYVF